MTMFRWFACALTVSLAAATAASAAVPPAPEAQASAAPAEKVRCKRYTETGSLAKVRKECHTEAEWQQLAVQGREEARQMMARTIGAGAAPH